MSLTNCFRKAGDLASPKDKAAVLALARSYRADGQSNDQAAQSALDQQIAELEAAEALAAEAVKANNKAKSDAQRAGPEIQKSAVRDQTDTPAFKAWFGDSAVVDDAGKPKVMYTGTSNDVDFKSFKIPKNGAWFTDNPSVASDYATENDSKDLKYDGRKFSEVNTAARVIPAYLSVQNPYTITPADKQRMDVENYKRAQGQLFDELRNKGHDGVKMGDHIWVVIGKPEQIKSSVGNSGAFDGGKKDIRKSAARIDKFHGMALRRASADIRVSAASAFADEPFTILPGVREVRLDDVELQTNAFLDSPLEQARIKTLAAQLTKSQSIEPVFVAQRADGSQYVAEGQHRAYALKFLGFKSLPARIMQEGRDVKLSPARRQFYSQLQRAIEGVPDRLATMNAPQWKLWLDANAGKLGVKRDELEFSGVKDFLDMRGKDKVTREEIAGYLDENGVKVNEVVLGGSPYQEFKTVRDAQDFLMSHHGQTRAELIDDYGYTNKDDYITVANELFVDLYPESAVSTKYANYTVPGGENYREILITLPDASEKAVVRLRAANNESDYNSARDDIDRIRATNYKSSHWDAPNVLAHLRVDDRTDSDGKKVLFINEVQSDWGQDGKKRGFKGDASKLITTDQLTTAHNAAIVALKEEELLGFDSAGEALRAIYAERNWRNSFEVSDANAEILQRRIDIETQWQTQGSTAKDLPPSAPFVGKTEAWVSLALKHAIMHAASNGYDKVAFINGEQAAGLYDLSKSVAELEYNLATNRLNAWDHSGKLVINKDGMSTQDLPDAVGKEVADRLLKTPMENGKHALSGLELKVGGEGMRTFYDTLVPQVANDVLKKLGGGKMGEVSLSQNDEAAKAWRKNWPDSPLKTLDQSGFDITPAMREKMAGGVPLFSPARDTADSAPRNQTDTPAFKTFFGDSVVTDTGKAGGVPLVVYHGTRSDIQSVEVGKSERLAGFWMTTDPKLANTYASEGVVNASSYREGANVMPLYARIEKPYRYDPKKKPMYMAWEEYQDGDFDGFIETGADAKGFTTLNVKSGEQVKSATGNNGNFDPASADITKSTTRADAIRDLQLAAGYTVGDLMKSSKQVTWWDKTVGSPYNLAQKKPEFKKVYDGIQNFLGDISRYGTRAADLAPSILPKLENLADITRSPLSPEDVVALRDPVFMGTLSFTRDADGNAVATDDVGLAGVVWRPEELRERFGLTGEKGADGKWSGQIGLYREFRNATNRSLNDLGVTDMLRYAGKDGAAVREQVLAAPNARAAHKILEDHLAELATTTPSRADVLQNTAAALKEKANAIQGLIAKGYAPLSRFGDHTVYVKGIDGEQIYFGMFETEREANKMERAMRAEYPDADVSTGTMSKESYKLFSGVTPETLALFGEALGLEESATDQQSQVFQEFLKLAKNSRSAMKRMIERKGVSGYSEDAGRVLAGFVYSNSRQASTNLHAGSISKSVSEIGPGDLKDQAIQLQQYVQNPAEEAQALRGLLFAQYIGGSLASAMVNLTQTLTTTWPTLSIRHGVAKAGAAMTDASSIAFKGPGNDEDLKSAMARAAEEGITAPQEVHQLMAQAVGRSALSAGDGTRFGNTLAKANNSLSKLQLVWGKMFGFAEQINRKTAFVAAYKLARAEGDPSAYQYAVDMVAQTQYVMNKGNNQNWARGPVGSTLFTFRKFSVNYLEGLSRMWGQGPEGKKAFALSLAILFMMAGAGGLPFVEDIDDIIDGFMQRVLNKNFSSKQAKKEFFASILGDAGADFVEGGLSSIPGVPIDFSGRMGMGNVVPGTGLFTKKRDYTRDVTEVGGAAFDFITRVLKSAAFTAQGDVTQAATTAFPIAATNVYKAIEMGRLGYYKDAKNRKVIDTTTAEAVLKGIGFQPQSVKNIQEASGTEQQLIALNKLRESEIADLWTRGRVEKDPEMVQKAKDQLADWNRDNPLSKINIDASQINRRVQQAMMDKAKRLTLTAPKEIRKSVKENLDRYERDPS